MARPSPSEVPQNYEALRKCNPRSWENKTAIEITHSIIISQSSAIEHEHSDITELVYQSWPHHFRSDQSSQSNCSISSLVFISSDTAPSRQTSTPPTQLNLSSSQINVRITTMSTVKYPVPKSAAPLPLKPVVKAISKGVEEAPIFLQSECFTWTSWVGTT